MPSPRVTIIPTDCPRFQAACATVGIGLGAHTPGVSNVYSKGLKYEPGEPGDIRYFLSDEKVNPLAIAKVWLDPHPDMAEAVALPKRLLSARTSDDLQSISSDLDSLVILCAAAHMSLFCSGRFKLPGLDLTTEESRAAQVLDKLPARIAKTQLSGKSKQALTAELCAAWKPGMIAWVKAWVANYRELRDVWQSARPAIKIERENRFPLIIPKGKDFYKLLKRWT